MAEKLGCFVADLDRMGYAELMGWSDYFRDQTQASKPEEKDIQDMNPAEIARTFNL